MKESWEIKKLGEIGKVCMCKRILKKQTLPVGDIPFYKIGTFGKTPNAFISKEVYQEYRSKYSFPKKGDILISASGTIGRRVIYDGEPAYFQDSNIVWIDNDEKEVLNSFLYKFYGFCNWNPSKGATISRLYNDNLRKIEIPVPPLPEQKRIVSILDQAFAAIDQAKANAEQNLKNAAALFESYLQGVFKKKGDGWEEKTLHELLDDNWITSHLDGNHGGDYPRKDEFVKSGVPYISANCLQNGYVNFEKAKYLTENRASKLRKGIAQNDDVLFAHNATVGPTALLQTSEEKVILGTSLTYYRCNKKYINPIYLLHYLRSNEFKSQYELIMRQSTRNQVPITKQRTFTHIIPPLKVQNELVPKLSNLINETEKLQSIYQKKIFDLEELKKSILQKAFAGELETETLETA